MKILFPKRIMVAILLLIAVPTMILLFGSVNESSILLENHNLVEVQAQEEADRIKWVIDDIMKYDDVNSYRKILLEQSIFIENEPIFYTINITDKAIIVKPIDEPYDDIMGIATFLEYDFITARGGSLFISEDNIYGQFSITLSVSNDYEYNTNIDGLYFIKELNFDCWYNPPLTLEKRILEDGSQESNHKQSGTFWNDLIQDFLQDSFDSEYDFQTPIETFLDGALEDGMPDLLRTYSNQHLKRLDDYQYCDVLSIQRSGDYIFITTTLGVNNTLEVRASSFDRVRCTFDNGDYDTYEPRNRQMFLDISNITDNIVFK